MDHPNSLLDPLRLYFVRLQHTAGSLAVVLWKGRLWFILAFSLIYLVLTFFQASCILLELDELCTFHISGARTIHEIWLALLSRADTNPPFQYIVVRGCFALFGKSGLVTRLPAIFGFLLMGLCMFKFVAEHSQGVCAYVAFLFPFSTAAYSLAPYARPYGLILGFCALSLLCWQSAIEHRFRILSLCGLTLSLIAATYTHFYAILFVMPIIVGEVVRSKITNTVDRQIWASVAIALLPVPMLIPLIKAAHAKSAYFFSKPTIRSIPDFYRILLEPAIFPLVIVLVFVVVYRAMASRKSITDVNRMTDIPLHEVAAAITLIGMPFMVGALAVTVTNAFGFTYPIAAVIGIGMIVGFMLDGLREEHTIIAVFIIVLLFGWFVAKVATLDVEIALRPNDTWSSAYGDDRITLSRYKALSLPAVGAEDQMPVAVADAHLFSQLSFYGPSNVTSRILYLTNRAGAIMYQGYDTDELTLTGLGPRAGMRIEDYRPFIQKHSQFLLLGSDGWVALQLVADHAKLHVVGYLADKFLYLVTMN
jgi:Dolichyl-phosphate-mannose-protein mannosyltransferase